MTDGCRDRRRVLAATLVTATAAALAGSALALVMALHGQEPPRWIAATALAGGGLALVGAAIGLVAAVRWRAHGRRQGRFPPMTAAAVRSLVGADLDEAVAGALVAIGDVIPAHHLAIWQDGSPPRLRWQRGAGATPSADPSPPAVLAAAHAAPGRGVAIGIGSAAAAGAPQLIAVGIACAGRPWGCLTLAVDGRACHPGDLGADGGLMIALETIAAALGGALVREPVAPMQPGDAGQVDDAARTQADFIAALSHEIRTPMNAVMGMTGRLLASDLTPDQRAWAATVRSSAEGC